LGFNWILLCYLHKKTKSSWSFGGLVYETSPDEHVFRMLLKCRDNQKKYQSNLVLSLIKLKKKWIHLSFSKIEYCLPKSPLESRISMFLLLLHGFSGLTLNTVQIKYINHIPLYPSPKCIYINSQCSKPVINVYIWFFNT
jgi:hypothetical protein